MYERDISNAYLNALIISEDEPSDVMEEVDNILAQALREFAEEHKELF